MAISFAAAAFALGALQINVQMKCDVAIVGAGPGGIYFAWRLLEAEPNSSVCMFERSERFGGRIYTLRGLGPKKDLTADMGAYRFVDAPTVSNWHQEYIYTPLVASLVENVRFSANLSNTTPHAFMIPARSVVEVDVAQAALQAS